MKTQHVVVKRPVAFLQKSWISVQSAQTKKKLFKKSLTHIGTLGKPA